MTIAELERAIASKRRQQERQHKEQATFDYILGDLIGRSVARIYNSSNDYPQIYEAYPTLFDNQTAIEKRQELETELSALRFRQFATSFNKHFINKEGKTTNE